MNTCLIVSGGELSPLPNNINYDFVYACDSGYHNAMQLGIKPDYIIGDFDSFRGDITKELEGLQISKHPVMKDDTDTMLAIKKAISDGFTHIIICCALGGRMDHTFANIQCLSYIASKGIIGELISKNEYLTVISGEGQITIDKKEDRALSLFSLSDFCSEVTIKGALYETDRITLTNTFPLGFGNSWVADTVTVSLKDGLLLIILSDKSHEIAN